MTRVQQEQPKLYGFVTTMNTPRLYISPCLFAVGLFGRIVSIVIFWSKKFHQVSCMTYLIAGACLDIVSLFIWLLVWPQVFIPDIYDVEGMCQFVTMLSSSCNFLSVWCTTSAVLDRTITLHTYPKLICTNLKARLILVFFLIISLVLYVMLYVKNGFTIAYPDTKLCVSSPTSVTVILIDLLCNFALPYPIIILLNVFCWIKIRQSKKIIKNPSKCEEALIQKQLMVPSFTEIQMSSLVFASSTFFVILNSPGHLFKIYAFSQENGDPSQLNTTAQQCLFYVSMTGISAKFFLHLFNVMFRKTLYLGLKCSDCLKLRSKILSIRYDFVSPPWRRNNSDSESSKKSRINKFLTGIDI